MIGILLATHGKFAQGIRESVEMLMGEIASLDTICLEEGEDISAFTSGIDAKIKELDDGDGVLLLVDIVGGSPFNVCAMALSKNSQCECITGLNLPMLVGALDAREYMSLKELKTELISNAKDGIRDVREALAN